MGVHPRDFFTAQTKAIPVHPALQGGAPVEFYQPGYGNGGSRTTGKLTQRNAKQHTLAYGDPTGKEAIDWVYDAVSFYADNGSTADYFFQNSTTDKRMWPAGAENKPKDGGTIPANLQRLFEAPNPFMDYMEFMSLIIQDLLLVGNSYWFKWRTNDQGQPLALYRMAPPYVTVTPGAWGIEKYEYKPTGAKKGIEAAPGEVVHLKLPNPHSAYLGLGVVQGGGRPLDLELALTESQASYHEKKGQPSMIVQSDRRVSREVFKKLWQQIRARNFGPRNSGDLMILESGLKASTLSPDAKNAMYGDLTRLSRDRILAMFRLPPKLLGIQDTGAGTDKAADHQRVFDNKAMSPLMTRIANKMTAELTLAWDAKFVIDYKYVMPEEDRIKLATEFAKLPGVSVRQVLEFTGLPPIGDDKMDDLVLNIPFDNGTQDFSRNGEPNRPLAGQPGRPPKGENVPAFGLPNTGGSARASEKGSRARLPANRGGKAVPSRSIEEILADLGVLEQKAVTLKQNVRTGVGSKLPDEKRPQDGLASFRDADVDAVAADMQAEFKDALHILERGLLDHSEGKAFDPKSLLRRVKNSASWASFQDVMAASLRKGYERALALAATHQGSLGVQPENDIDYAKIANDLVERDAGIAGITDTLKESLLDKIEKELAAGGGQPDIQSLIQDQIALWKVNKSDLVAVTEATIAYNEGTLAVVEEAGFAEVFVTDGTDDDQPCIDADGQVWSIEEARANRIEHPRCRRAFVAFGG